MLIFVENNNPKKRLIMKKLLLTLIMLAAGIGISKAANTAGIVMTEQTVDMDAGVLKFVGENTANNYRYTLEAYEFSDRGPRFQLVIDRIDASKPATFTASDLADPNYWEPLFRYFTKQLAGEEIEAAESIKKLYINNVAVLPNQFQGYCDGLNEVYITADGDYTIPDQCFDFG